jgi:uncharacterized repeat protein (TIGR01451 family)
MQSDLWLLVSALLVFLGLVASQGLLLIVGSLVILIWLATRLWGRYAFRRVSHTRSLSRHRAFIGDSLEYTVTLSNDKLLPLIWVDIQDAFPEGLELPGANLRASNMEGTRQHGITTSLLPFQQVTWTYSLRCAARGYHRIGPVRLRSGDIFGFNAAETRFSEMEYVLVYPRIVDLGPLAIPAEHPLGAGRGQRPLHRDTTRFMGLREYNTTDPMKHIDWKATARTSRLQTKVFEPIVSLNVLVALNATTSEHPWEGTNRRLFERAVTVAASAAEYASRRGYSFGVISNAVASYSGKWLSVPVGASSSQLSLVLEALAMAGPYAVTSLTRVLQIEQDSMPPGATVVLVTSVITSILAQDVAAMKERGYHVLVLYSGDGGPEMKLPDVPVFLAGPALDPLEANERLLAK